MRNISQDIGGENEKQNKNKQQTKRKTTGKKENNQIITFENVFSMVKISINIKSCHLSSLILCKTTGLAYASSSAKPPTKLH